MLLGIIGLGQMGANMAMRGHECIVYDSHPEPVQELVKQGAKWELPQPFALSMAGSIPA